MTIYSNSGQRLADTFWVYRRLEFKNATAIAVANTVTGMSTLISADLLSIAMPFPALPGRPYHDRWLGLVALAKAELHYVDRALARYIQHGGSHTGVLKRPVSAMNLIVSFLKCFRLLFIATLRPSARDRIPKRLALIEYWNNVEMLSLTLQIDTLQNRLPQTRWQPDVWRQFKAISVRPSSAIFRVPLSSLSDSYRRHMVIGLAFGSISESIIFLGLKNTRLLRNLSPIRR
jgi:hypothetical protein